MTTRRASREQRDHGPVACRRTWARLAALHLGALAVVGTVSGATAAADTSGRGSDALGAAAVSVGTPAEAVDAAITGQLCADETTRWGGAQQLDAATPSFDTGVDVPPAELGETVTVVGVSADGVGDDGVAAALPVFVGGAAAAPGAAVLGGDVVVVTDGTRTVRVAGVTVVVRRCAEVAVAAVAPTPVTSSTSAAMPTPAEVEAVVATLPATGGDSWITSAIGAALVAAGLGLVSLGRRSRSAH